MTDHDDDIEDRECDGRGQVVEDGSWDLVGRGWGKHFDEEQPDMEVGIPATCSSGSRFEHTSP